MNIEKLVSEFNNLSLSDIKEKVREIKESLPEEERKVITFSKNFTLSLSNYCQNNCSYCFYNHRIPKKGEDENIILLEKDKIEELIRRGNEYNCKEALIMSGERPESFHIVKNRLNISGYENYIDFIENVCNITLNSYILPHINVGVLSYDEMNRLKSCSASMGLMLESTSPRLMEKGNVHEFSPGKVPNLRITHIEEAGKLKIPFTTGLLIGIGETFYDRIKDLLLIKELHRKYNHIQEVIIQNFAYKDRISYKPTQEINVRSLLKIVGLARIIFENEISIQIPPNLTEGFIGDFIEVGVNDLGGISPFSIDYINPEKRWPQIDYIKRKCKQIGYKLKERLPIYQKYIENTEFVNKNVLKIIKEIYNSSKFI
ncbi:MAG: 7,8-didemethyl-8-hydroxy-5-deazariboflavin synthase subunit CofG [Candidatus Lokiarchaeota archaeon]